MVHLLGLEVYCTVVLDQRGFRSGTLLVLVSLYDTSTKEASCVSFPRVCTKWATRQSNSVVRCVQILAMIEYGASDYCRYSIYLSFSWGHNRCWNAFMNESTHRWQEVVLVSNSSFFSATDRDFTPKQGKPVPLPNVEAQLLSNASNTSTFYRRIRSAKDGRNIFLPCTLSIYSLWIEDKWVRHTHDKFRWRAFRWRAKNGSLTC